VVIPFIEKQLFNFLWEKTATIGKLFEENIQCTLGGKYYLLMQTLHPEDRHFILKTWGTLNLLGWSSPCRTVIENEQWILTFKIIYLVYYFCTVGTLWHLHKFLQYIIAEFTPSVILLYPLPIPGIVSTGLIFPLISMSTQYLHHVHLLHSPHILLHPTKTNPPNRTSSTLLVSFL
jgi:hypothetical protein